MATGDAGRDGAADVGDHLRVEGVWIVLHHQAGGCLVDAFTAALAKNTTGWERGNPNIAAVLVAKDAVRKTPGKMILLGEPFFHRIDRLLVVVGQIDQQGVLSLRDFRAQPVANRDEIVLGDVKPLVALEEGLEVADVVGGHRQNVLRQSLQLLGQHFGIAKIRLAIGRPNANKQKRHVPHALLRPLERDDTWIVAGEKFGEGGLKLQLRGEKTRASEDRENRKQNRTRAA